MMDSRKALLGVVLLIWNESHGDGYCLAQPYSVGTVLSFDQDFASVT